MKTKETVFTVSFFLKIICQFVKITHTIDGGVKTYANDIYSIRPEM